jgi:hypothetical protein
MADKYPILQKSIIKAISDEDPHVFSDFQIQFYQNFISAVFATKDPSESICGQFINNPEREDLQIQWVADYIEAVFNILFIQTDFLDYFFNPVMDLFIKYFFPVELDYMTDLIKRVSVKNKWNSIATEESLTLFTKCNNTSLQTPIRGLDRKSFYIRMHNIHSYIDKIDLPATLTQHVHIESYQPDDGSSVFPINIIKDPLNLKDRSASYRFRNNTSNKETVLSLCFNLSRTKDYQLADFLGELFAHINKIN